MAANALLSLKDEITAELKQISKTVAPPSVNIIKTKGKVFTTPDGKTSPGPLRVVILDWRHHHDFFQGVYNPNKPQSPTCYSMSKVIEDLKPCAGASKPQAETCEACPQNQWGSAPQGGNGKACKNSLRLAVVPADADEGTAPSMLQVSPTGIKSFNRLVHDLKSADMIPAQVVAEISFNPNEAYPQLVFSIAEAHDNLEAIMAIRRNAQKALDREPNYE